MNKLVLVFLLSGFFGKSFAQCGPGTASMNLDVNNVRARINNGGDMWWNLVDSAGYQVPIDSSEALWLAGALWIGGLDQDNQLHVAAQTYRQTGFDFFPGPLNPGGTTDSSLCNQFDQMWNVYGTEIDSAIAAFNAYGILVPLSMIPQNVLLWPGKGNPYNLIAGTRDLAPFYDHDMNGLYNPRRGDYPIVGGCGNPVYADQMIWWVYNDAGNAHTESGAEPLGIEVQALAYAFATTDCINDQTFYRYKIFNRSLNDYHDVYAGVWLDPDMGCYTDDLIGCDTISNLGIAYNTFSTDTPCNQDNSKMLGVKILNSLANNSSQRPMSNFMFYNNDFTDFGNPEEAQHYYNYLQSMFKDATHLTQGGVPTDYAFPDDPTMPTGWSECAQPGTAADRRIIVSTGPATLPANAELVLDFALVWAIAAVDSNAPCPSFDLIKQCAAAVQQLYDEQLCDNSFVNVNDVKTDNALTLFPNPASQTVRLNLTENALVEVFDVHGKRMRSQQMSSQQNTIDLNGLVQGCYVVKTTAASRTVQRAKLAVQ